jgi:hypothetical protein
MFYGHILSYFIISWVLVVKMERDFLQSNHSQHILNRNGTKLKHVNGFYLLFSEYKNKKLTQQFYDGYG